MFTGKWKIPPSPPSLPPPLTHLKFYSETWEKVNIVENDNGTLSYNLRKIYKFREDLSAGPEDDVVIVPNIPMLSATSQSKHAARWENYSSYIIGSRI